MKKILAITIVLSLFLLSAIFYFNKNSNEDSGNLSLVKGNWIADGTQHIFVIGYENGEKIYSDNKTPFYLDLDEKGNYTLKMNAHNEKGTYSMTKDGEIFFKTADGLMSEHCQLKNKTELHCDKYASLYTKTR